MKYLLVFFCLALSSSISGQTLEFNYHDDFQQILDQTNNPDNPLYYDVLLNRFHHNDTTLTDFEVLALLIGFTDNKYFSPYQYTNVEREIYSLNDYGQYQQALLLCDSLLPFVPVSQQALLEKSYAWHKMGREDSAACYLWRFRKIMSAMEGSGDGLTPETGFFSLGPTDGQTFIRKILGGDIGLMGSARDSYGNFVDVLEMIQEDEGSGEIIRKMLYFNIQHAFGRM